MGKPNSVMFLLGIAMKGGFIASGEHQTLEAIRTGKAKLVIVSADASDNTRKLFRDKSTFYHVPVYEYGNKEDLGRAIGKDLRSSLAVCDEGLAASLTRQLGEETLG